MSRAFPADLADQVVARWHTFVARHDRPAPPLPNPACLKQMLETAFFASFAREEGRDLRFVFCCAPTLAVPSEGEGDVIPVMTFEMPRPLEVETVRSLAPAVSPRNAAMLIRFPVDEGATACDIVGLVNMRSNPSHGQHAAVGAPSPYALVIQVRGAGELHVYRAGIELATLRSGSLQDQLAFSELEFLPISDLLARGNTVLGARIQRPSDEPAPETSDFEWTALLNTLLAIVNGLEEHGHGGTLLLSAPGAERTLPVHMKFDVDARTSLLADRFVSFVNARHALVARRREVAGSAGVPLADLQRATLAAEHHLSDAADFVARLSAVDGALIVGFDLRVLGFGAEIVVDAARPVTAYEVSGHAQRPGVWPVIDADTFGMRHRSALRCVATADDTAAFVVSQDRTVSFFWKQDGKVLIKRDVTIANPNMTGVGLW